jgi:hypothetical protein
MDMLEVLASEGPEEERADGLRQLALYAPTMSDDDLERLYRLG